VARGAVRGGPELWEALLPRVQRSLPDSTAMVGWVDSRYGGRLPDWPFWCFVVRKTGEPTWFRVEAPAKNQEPLLFEVRRFVGAMHAEADWPLRLESSPELERLGSEMYRLRFAPLEPALSGIRSLVFASPDMNYCSPVEAMIDDQGRYIADRFVTLYSPSALLYAIAREQQPRPIDRRHWKALLVGSPVGEHPSLWDSLPPVRNAAREIHTIAARLPDADVLVGKLAAESGLASLRDSGRLAAYDVVHFATHAYLAAAPWEERSALLLAEAQPLEPNLAAVGPPARIDGWLTAAEITNTWRLNAQLVSLAACRGSAAGFAMANGPTGIGAAFLDAGAHCVLMSPYAIDDEASGLFFKEYAALMFSNDGPPIESAVAVRAARSRLRAYRAPDGTYPYRSPAFWAAFVLMGGPD
jgi:CHAT domain-containing protein